MVSLFARVLDPQRGTVPDPACGSGGMFVRSARTVAEQSQRPTERHTFRGLEKNATTIRLALPTVTPRHVIRRAFQARLIQDGDAWIDMLTDPKLMSHTYDFAKFEVVTRKNRRQYLGILGEFL